MWCRDVDDDEEADPNFEIFSEHLSVSEESDKEEENRSKIHDWQYKMHV